MTFLSEFAARQKEYSNKMDVALAGIQGDFRTLNDTIKQLQESNGQITASDQKLLDAIEVHSKGLAEKLSDLDDLTPPMTPA